MNNYSTVSVHYDPLDQYDLGFILVQTNTVRKKMGSYVSREGHIGPIGNPEYEAIESMAMGPTN